MQRHLLRETMKPGQSRQMAINMKMGESDQIKINSNTQLKLNSVHNTSAYRPDNRQQQKNSIFTRRNQSNRCHKIGKIQHKKQFGIQLIR